MKAKPDAAVGTVDGSPGLKASQPTAAAPLLGDVTSRAQRQGLIQRRQREGAIESARRLNLHHARSEDTSPPSTPIEQELVRRAQDKRDRKRIHRFGGITVIEADQ